MKKWKRLVAKAVKVRLATTSGERMKALYDLRALLNSVDPLEMFISVETELSELESQLTPQDKQDMITRGYIFPEDFDEVKKMLLGE